MSPPKSCFGEGEKKLLPDEQSNGLYGYRTLQKKNGPFFFFPPTILG